MVKHKSKTPTWLRGELSSTDLAAIESMVAKQELRTSGEIVPMIVRSSGLYAWVGMVSALFALTLFFGGIYFYPTSLSFWPTLAWGLLCWTAGLTIMLCPPIRRALVPKGERKQAAILRAHTEFHHLNMHQTQDRTGILIFLSTFEHQVVVLADRGIAKLLPADTWETLVDKLVTAASKKQLSKGFLTAIEDCGDLLSDHFPRAEDDKNELNDRLIIKE